MKTSQGALALYGPPLSDAGFEVIHVDHGKKGPTISSWQSIATSPSIVRGWASNGKANCNVGIRTKFTPAVDIDILDADFSEYLTQWCLDNIGAAPTRVGRAPKTLLVYGTDKPFHKKLLTLIDPEGVQQKIEILGEGQQFIAYGIHEDTRKPYVWTSSTDLASMETWELTTLGPADIDRLFDEAEKQAKLRGWKVKSRSGKQVETDDEDGDLADYQLGTDFTDEELQKFLDVLDPDTGYDYWLQVGQALHHHFEGDPRGLELWDEWSERSFDYNPSECRSKWKSFRLDRSGKSVTAKTLAHWAQDALREQSKASFEDVLKEIEACTDVASISDGTLIKTVANRVTDPGQFDRVIDKLREKVKEFGASIRVETLRKMLRKSVQKSVKGGQLPDWCSCYVYVTDDDQFYNTDIHLSVTERGFNALFNRLIGSQGAESVSAARFALDTLQMPVANRFTYLPASPPIVERNGITLVNKYNSKGVPAIPSITTSEEDEAIETVENHFKMLFPDDREREILISYFAYTVQALDHRVNWAPLIHGGEGAGKTFCMELMRNVLGMQNVTPINAKQLRGEFTSWAEGRKLVVFEEIRLSGQNRYEILDTLKPYITNNLVDVRRMRTDPYMVENVTNYLMFTNYGDALPLAAGDRRYFVLSTSLMSGGAIKRFNLNNPGYYDKLFTAIKEHPGALLKWLTEWILHPEFVPHKHAPETNSKQVMREGGHDDAFDGLEAFLNSSPAWDISNELLCLKSLTDLVSAGSFDGRAIDFELPASNRMKPLLLQLGFHAMGRARPGKAGPQGGETAPQRYWSREPELIQKQGGLQDFVRMKLYGEDDLGLD